MGLARVVVPVASLAAWIVACVGSDPDPAIDAHDGGGATSSGSATSSSSSGGASTGDASSSSSGGAGVSCSPLDPFNQLDPIPNNSSGEDPFLTKDEMTLYFSRGGRLQVATRAPNQPWNSGSDVKGEINDPAGATHLSPVLVTSTTLFFGVAGGDAGAKFDIWSSTNGGDGKWPAGKKVSVTSGVGNDVPTAYAAGLLFYLQDYNLFQVPVVDGAPSGATSQLSTGQLNVRAATSDGKTIYLSQLDKIGGHTDIVYAQRAGTDVPFGGVTPVGGSVVNTADGDETASWISPDGCRLYFTRDPPAVGALKQIYVASRQPR